ncbi:hypothetical protein [Salinicoccus albus]|uniref:hypothetical protein n=1 Tax=Salinicoccus albus TaxID=418756 RepID=UPI000360CB6F|nr:hypothetical protein [Salinicoccus albus]
MRLLKRTMDTSVHNFYYKSPVFLQNVMTSLYGYKLRRERYSHLYQASLKHFMQGGIDETQSLIKLMYHLKRNIPVYRNIEIDEAHIIESFLALPVTTKSDLRNALDARSHKAGILRKSRTSGTTGANLAVYDSEYDRAERMAYLDYIKVTNGVEPFSRRASFTGQELTPPKHKNVLWRYNLAMDQMLYASCHITPQNVKHVYKNLQRFKPAALDGYPSTIHMVAKYILSNHLRPDFDVKAVFPNAETLLPHVKADIENAFDTKVIDQYSTAEGAPFIYGTDDGQYRIGHETGLIEFEKTGHHLYEMIVTSYINDATPIVRYRIGDQVEIHSGRAYLNSFVDDVQIQRIIGRQSDYLLGSQSNKVTSVNISWVADGFEEKIIQMQFVQKERDQFVVNLAVEDDFESADETVIRGRLARRLGKDNTYVFNYMDEIPKEKSGKIRFIINELDADA